MANKKLLSAKQQGMDLSCRCYQLQSSTGKSTLPVLENGFTKIS